MIVEAFVLDGTIVSIEFIAGELRKVEGICFNSPSIRKSNEIYEKALIKAKEKAFDRINDMSKPYVVYQVNRYFLSGERFIPKYFKNDLEV